MSLSLGFLRLETVGVAGYNWRTTGAWPRSWLNWTGFISVLSQGISKLGLERKKILLKLSLALSIKGKHTLTEFITNSWKSRRQDINYLFSKYLFSPSEFAKMFMLSPGRPPSGNRFSNANRKSSALFEVLSCKEISYNLLIYQ